MDLEVDTEELRFLYLCCFEGYETASFHPWRFVSAFCTYADALEFVRERADGYTKWRIFHWATRTTTEVA